MRGSHEELVPGLLKVTIGARGTLMKRTANPGQNDLQVILLFLVAAATIRVRGAQDQLQSNLNLHPPAPLPCMLRRINILVAVLPSIRESLHNSRKNYLQNE